jgi:hypothetical protein
MKTKAKRYVGVAIMDAGRDDGAYLARWDACGPVFRHTPTVFPKREAQRLLARARAAGWLVGDLEVVPQWRSR